MALFENYFGDPRYRTERILLVIAAPITLLLIGGLVYLLFVLDSREEDKPTILTADQVTEDIVPVVDITPLQKGEEAISNSDFDQAREYFLSVQGGDRPEALRKLALISRQQGKHQEAVDFLTESIELQPSAIAFFMRGDSLRTLKNIEQARADIEEAVARNPSEPLFSNALLLLRLEQGEWEQVEETLQLRAFLELASTVPSWVLAGAAVSLAKGADADAAVLMQQAVALIPESSFDLLLSYQALEQFHNHPILLPYYMKTSTVRQR